MPAAIPLIAGAFLAAGTVATALGVTAVAFTVAGLAVSWAAVATITGVALMGVAMLSMKRPKPGSSGGQLDSKLDVRAPIPVAYGRTATGGYITYQQSWGKKNSLLALVSVLSAGPVAAIETHKASDSTVYYSGDPTTGLATAQGVGDGSKLYKGKLRQRFQLGEAPASQTVTQASGLPLPGSPGKLSGLAHTISVWEYNTDAFPQGVPKNLWVLRGVKLYDPRKDSTYPGGSGSHRRDNHLTWEYSENPYLAALDWTLGRWWNGKKVYGIGARFEEVDVAAFVNGANVADANNWKIGGVVTTADNKFAVLSTILQSGGGVPTARGAQLSCTVNAPKTSTFTLTSQDIIGEVEIVNTTTWRDRSNTVVPSYREESQLWAMIAGEQVSSDVYVTEDAGERKTIEVDYPLVQQAAQAHQLATYELCNSREFLTFTVTAKVRALNVRVGDAITVNIPEVAAVSKKCVVISREFNPGDLSVSLTLKSETDDKHPFALGQSQVAPPAPALNGYNPSNPGAPDATAWSATGGEITAPDGSKMPAIIIAGETDDPNASNVIVEYRPAGSSVWLAGGDYPATARTIELTSVTAQTLYDVAIRYRTVRGVVSEPLSLSATAGAQTVNWATVVTGEGKPADNATVGAVVGVDVRNPDGTIFVPPVAEVDMDEVRAEIDREIAETKTAIDAHIASVKQSATDARAEAERARSDAAAASAQAAQVRTDLVPAITDAKNAGTDASAEAATVRDNLTAEVSRAQGVEGTLSTRITTAQGRADTAHTAITEERTQRAAVDTALSNKVDTVEAKLAGTVDSELAARIRSEETARVAADNAVAARTTAIETSARSSGNMVPNSDLATLDGWTLSHNGIGASTPRIRIDADYWIPRGESVLYTDRPGTNGNINEYVEMLSPRFAVQPGTWLQFYALTASHRQRSWVSLFLYSDDGSWHSYAGENFGARVNNGGPDLAGWDNTGLKAFKVPSGALQARLSWRVYGVNNGEENGVAWMFRPFVGLAREGQTEWTPYSPGSSRPQTVATNAKIADEAVTRSTADTALSNRLTTTEAQLNFSQDSEMGRRLNVVDARVSTEETARVTVDSALANRIATTEAQLSYSQPSGMSHAVVTVDARVTDEAVTRAAQDSALSTRITTTEAKLSGAQDSELAARIRAEETARVDAVATVADRTTGLEASAKTRRTDVAALFPGFERQAEFWGYDTQANGRNVGASWELNHTKGSGISFAPNIGSHLYMDPFDGWIRTVVGRRYRAGFWVWQWSAPNGYGGNARLYWEGHNIDHSVGDYLGSSFDSPEATRSFYSAIPNGAWHCYAGDLVIDDALMQRNAYWVRPRINIDGIPAGAGYVIAGWFFSEVSGEARTTARIATEETTRANADTALSNRTNTVEAQLAYSQPSGMSNAIVTVDARVTDEAVTRAAQDSALSSRITTTEAKLSGSQDSELAARIRNEETARVTADGALANRSATLESQMSGTAGSPLKTLIQNNRKNLVRVDWWQKAASIPWPLNGGQRNEITEFPHGGNFDLLPMPDGSSGDAWLCQADAGGQANGGWNGGQIVPLDPDRTYRFIVPIAQLGNRGPRHAYWGTGGVCDLNTTTDNTNPYFAVAGDMTPNRWHLFVGYIFPRNSWGKTHAGAGVYDMVTGELVAQGANYCFHPDGRQPDHRAYQYYAYNGSYQVFGRPLVEIVDGSETPFPILSTYARNISARISTEETTRTAADSALANRATTIEAKLDGAQDSTLAARIRDEASARANADDAIAVRTTSLESSARGSGNLLSNTSFATIDGWTTYNNPNSWGVVGINGNGDDWRPAGENSLSINEFEPHSGNFVEVVSDQFSVTPNEWIQFYARTSNHRCRAWVSLYFYSGPSPAYTDYAGENYSPNRDNGGRSIGGWDYTGLKKIKVPANATGARMVLRKYTTDTGGAHSVAWFTRPFVGPVTDKTDAWMPFIAGNDLVANRAITAKIADEATTRATQDGALAGRIATTEAQFRREVASPLGNVVGALETENATRSSEIIAANARINAEENARANADSALANRANSIEATYNRSGVGITANDRFANWPDGSRYPRDWSDWMTEASYGVSRSGGMGGSQYAVYTTGNADGNAGFMQTVPCPDGRYVVEVTVRNDGGSMSGAGVTLHGSYNLDFMSDPDTLGAVGETPVGKTRTWAKLFNIAGYGGGINVHAMQGWTGFGRSIVSHYITWFKLIVRPAGPGDIAGVQNTADIAAATARIASEETARANADSALATRSTNLEARAGSVESRVSTTEGAIASINGRTAAYWQVEAVAGGRAKLRAYADSYGSNIDIAADTVILGNQRTLAVENGRVTIAGDLYAGNGRVIFDNGTVMKVQGTGFGSNNQFVEWFGPKQTSVNNCTESNATYYLKTNGSAYFGGALSAGVIKNSVQTTVLIGTANVTTGNFGSNGGSRIVTVGYTGSGYESVSGSCPAYYTPFAKIRLYRGTDANGTFLTEQQINGYHECEPATRSGATTEPGSQYDSIGGSFTYTDNSGGSSTSYFVQIVDRVLRGAVSQSLSLTSVEG